MADLPVLALGIEEGIEDLLQSVHDNHPGERAAVGELTRDSPA
jgi:hypothetical protein